MKKALNFRKMFYWERLKHWYPLLVSKWRERKSALSGHDYTKEIGKIILIQSVFRGAIVRKFKIWWKKECFKLRASKKDLVFYMKKQILWKSGLSNEDLAFCYSKSAEEDIYGFLAQCDSKQRRKDEKAVSEILKLKEKSEVEIRNKFHYNARADRIKSLE